MNKLTWNVFIYDINRKLIIRYNVFDHGGFRKYVNEDLVKSESKSEFEKLLKNEAMYYFWSKYEWEIAIAPLFDVTERSSLKVDVYMQLQNNWSAFVDYVWSFKSSGESHD